jgi:hypothetical protein
VKPDYQRNRFHDMPGKPQSELLNQTARELDQMSDGERLRQRCKRLLELASRAYCEKHYDFARLLIQLAAEVLEHASEMDESPEAQSRPRVASPVRR